MKRIGIDIGSTTIKLVIIDEKNKAIFHEYKRHNAQIYNTLVQLLREAEQYIEDSIAEIKFTGSVGYGIAEKLNLAFVQEVVAATTYTQTEYKEVRTIIDIGGEDAKIVILEGKNTDLRMNGNCAGGTGAFIDQMSILLNISPDMLNELSLKAKHTYPIASRCGVFSKTDIQNLISKNVCKEDIALSILHAVAVQTITTLSHGTKLKEPILLCGGPFTFIPALANAFADYLKIPISDFILPPFSHLIPAYGTALSQTKGSAVSIHNIIQQIEALVSKSVPNSSLPALFKNEQEYHEWAEKKLKHTIERGELHQGTTHVYLGIDSGSTTTKIIMLEANSGKLLFRHYSPNMGNPIQAVKDGLNKALQMCQEKGANIVIDGSCSTGYGEELIKASFGLEHGIVETIAHYKAAIKITPSVSFILDIGGQDMKAIFIEKGSINRIEINEACSSGCGSFIETFAKTLGYSTEEFAHAACSAQHPVDLGTRCTVFMNSKVKQALREGASIEDLAAGLSYSVIKNCLYKVLKLRDSRELGKHIVVQGGTMRNDSIVKAFEMLTDTTISRCDIPEMMGAYGCALYAKENHTQNITLENILETANYSTQQSFCAGCENQCLITRYNFQNGEKFYSGNKCERIFSNKGNSFKKGENIYNLKNRYLFERITPKNNGIKIGIPRCLNMYENYPFWHALLINCGLTPILSEPSRFKEYEDTSCYVMSDNICFPAKIAHSHIKQLQDEKHVDRILMPFVIHEKQLTNETNSYNCPIVTGYGEVIKNVMMLKIPFDEPIVSFKDKKLLEQQCISYLNSLGIDNQTASKAFYSACEAQNNFEQELKMANKSIYENSLRSGKLCIMLAGRPYHSDMLIQHKLSEIISEMGVNVISDDLVRDTSSNNAQYVAQWSFPNRILRAAQWTANASPLIQFVEMTSFGCGPDAFLTDEIKNILSTGGKALTLIKIDDINNVGSMRLRIRSLIDSFTPQKITTDTTSLQTTSPVFEKKDKKKKIIIPYFTPFISPLIPELLHISNYDVECLPISDMESAEYGLRYANNEICYPATLVIGDIVKAFKSGKYDPSKTTVAFVQTGGQCRATNYLPLIKKALLEAGFEKVPVACVSLGSGVDNFQPGFKINWLKTIPATIHALLFSDCLAQFYYATLPRELQTGMSSKLLDKYLHLGKALIRTNKSEKLLPLIQEAAYDFKNACNCKKHCSRVGIVGEIYLKYNSFSHKNIPAWLAKQGFEIVPPLLTPFFTQYFVNRKIRQNAHIEKNHLPQTIYNRLYQYVRKKMETANMYANEFPYYIPFHDIFEEAEHVEDIITLNAQFGEGWLLPAEIVQYIQTGINNVICFQPFGCIANHIVSKGMEKRLKLLYPELNFLSLDFDSGVSDANITNRLLLFIHSIETTSTQQ